MPPIPGTLQLRPVDIIVAEPMLPAHATDAVVEAADALETAPGVASSAAAADAAAGDVEDAFASGLGLFPVNPFFLCPAWDTDEATSRDIGVDRFGSQRSPLDRKLLADLTSRCGELLELYTEAQADLLEAVRARLLVLTAALCASRDQHIVGLALLAAHKPAPAPEAAAYESAARRSAAGAMVSSAAAPAPAKRARRGSSDSAAATDAAGALQAGAAAASASAAAAAGAAPFPLPRPWQVYSQALDFLALRRVGHISAGVAHVLELLRGLVRNATYDTCRRLQVSLAVANIRCPGSWAACRSRPSSRRQAQCGVVGKRTAC